MNDTVDSVVPVTADKDCILLDALDFQVGAIARVTGEYAGEWPDPVRILGIEKQRYGEVNITIGCPDGSCPTDGFSVDEIVPEARHRLTAERKHEAEVERLRAMIVQLGENAATAAKEYSERLERMRKALWLIETGALDGFECAVKARQALGESQ